MDGRRYYGKALCLIFIGAIGKVAVFMVAIVLGLVACIFLFGILNDDAGERAFNEYCNLECRSRKHKKYKFCC